MKKSVIFVFLAIFLFSFVLAQIPTPTLFPTTNPSPTFTSPASKIEIIKQQNPNLGYLIEFSLSPVAESKSNDIIYKKKIDKQHSEIIAKIIEKVAKKRGKSNIEIKSKILKKSYKKVFNGVLLDITKEEGDEISNIQGIKRVVLNREVSVLLSESVPFIGADKVWELDNEGKPCKTSGKDCITGKGVKIGILDTGIDYTHPDLGSSIIEERLLERITQEPVMLFFKDRFAADDNQILSLDNNRLAYFSANKILIYNFNTKETDYTFIPEGLDQIIRMTMKDNIIVYAATDKNLDNPGIYYYNIDTKMHHKLSETRIIEIFRISKGKIVYTKLLEEDPPSLAMVVYDISTGEETTISKVNEKSEYSFSSPVADDNYVVYSTYKIDGGICYENAIIHNIDTGEKKEIHPPDIGPIFDIKDNKILYVACSKDNFDESWSTYYLWDINTEESIQFKTRNPSTGNIQNNLIPANKVGIKGSVNVRGWINKGRIEDEVLFLSKDVNADKIVIYDRIKQRYALLNLLKYAGGFDSEENKVCFMSNDRHIYCHDYDSTLAYELPKNIFNNKVVGGYDISNNDNDPFDDNGHGTHVAGIVAGKGILKGVSPDAELYAYKVLDIYGRGSDADVIEGIERAVDPNNDDDFSDKMDIISMSFGGKGDPDDILSKIVDRTVDLGVNVIVSAGNSGPEGESHCRHNVDDGNQNSICSPGTARKAITVGATKDTAQVLITWGEESDYANHGIEKDSFHCTPPNIGNRCAELSAEILSKIDEARSLVQERGKKLIDKEGEPAELGDFYVLYSPDNADKIRIFEITYMPDALTNDAFIILHDFLSDQYFPYNIGADGENFIFFDMQFFYFKINLLKGAGITGFSSRGPVIWQDVNAREQILMKPDIAAPGFKICSAMSSYFLGANCKDQQHVTFSGSSMAAPHVTGVVALLKQKNPNLLPEDIKNILKSTAVDLNLPENVQGSGRVRALESAFGFIRGDSNRNGAVDVSDAVFLLNFLFKDGEPLICFDAGDANDNGIIDISDAIKILVFLFREGQTMPTPYPNTGIDATPDNLGC